MTNNRVNYLDGLRGILAVIVFVHHFLYAFVPRVIFGGTAQEFLTHNPYSFSRLIALTPINFFFNPGSAIMFFFILSGYVQTRIYFKTNDLVFLQKSFIKRYFRLAIPTISVVLIVFLFHKLHLIRNDLFPPNDLTVDWIKSQMPDNRGILDVIYHGVYECFVGSSKYYQVLWTMPVELFNSYLVLVLAMATHNLNNNRRWIFVFWLIVQLFFLHSYNGASFTLGMLLASLQQNSRSFSTFFSKPLVNLSCWVIGLYFGSYPYTAYEGSTGKSVYSLISFFDVYMHIISYVIGVTFMLCALLYSKRIQRLLSGKVLDFFGKISFMFYLIHFTILFSFSPWLYQKLLPQVSFSLNLVITGVLSFVLTTLASYILYLFIDNPTIKLCNDYVKRLFSFSNPAVNNSNDK